MKIANFIRKNSRPIFKFVDGIHSTIYDRLNRKNLRKEFENLFQSTKFPLKFNRILDDQARSDFQKVIGFMHKLTPKMMKRKIPRANIQQAFIFFAVTHFYKPGAKILCVGSHEDTAFHSLHKLGIEMEDIDPVKDYDLNTFTSLPSTQKGSYDIIFSTSVIEHVEHDDLFLSQIQELLKPEGVGILTCDYKDSYKTGDYIFPGNFRFYTQKSLKAKFKQAIAQCELVDNPSWDCPDPDFFFEGQRYTFATFVFKKKLLSDIS